MPKIQSIKAERKILFRQMSTAIWTCASLEILILFSIWQSLPVIGQPVNVIIVGAVLIFWIVGLVIYRLTLGRRHMADFRRKRIYQNYLP